MTAQSDPASKNISVIIPAKNAEKTLTTTLDSLKKIRYELLEVIVIDDGSEDETRKIGENHALVTTYLYHQQSLGPGPCRNLGAKLAQGDFLLFIDADVAYAADFDKAISLLKNKLRDFWHSEYLHQKNLLPPLLLPL